MRTQTLPCAALAASLLCAACGDDPGPRRADADAGNSPVLGADAAPACGAGQREPCVCSTGGIGSRPCVAGSFTGACESCVAREDTASGNLCVPGRYEGTYDVPSYYPTPAGFCGLVAVFGGGGAGTWKFTLGASGAAEFVTVVEAESCLELITTGPSDGGVAGADAGSQDAGASADGGAITPLKLALTGKVNCATGDFVGELRGTYRSVSVCTLGETEDDYFLKGPIKATFDPKTQSFTNGTVDLHEPPSLLGIGAKTGGSGTWQATLNPSAVSPPPEDCLGGVAFEDFTVP